ncbi:MAG: DUF2167 domain-containing protein [Saprospiraceae bacterium]
MKKMILTGMALLLSVALAWSQTDDAAIEAQMKHLIDSISASYQYQTGQITLGEGLATMQVPAGFRYLNAAQSKQILEDIWGNPPGQATLGMLFPEKMGPLDSASFAFNISFEDMGYVKDDDADKINYTELMTQLQKDSEEENKKRVKEGFEPIVFIGWASDPFYDKEKKTLHWAKELKVGEFPDNTLNYDVRILGRKGVLSLNAIGMMGQLEPIKGAVPAIANVVAFTEGNRYSDFSKSSGDKIAAWTIGGLVAGKILAKAGLFAILLKFGKLIILAILGGGAAIWRFISGRKKQEEEATAFESIGTPNSSPTNNTPDHNDGPAA